MLRKKILKNMPRAAEHLLRLAYGTIPASVRYGRIYRDTISLLNESQWWSREKLKEYQTQRLRLLVHHVYENVPYYRRTFHTHGLRPEDFRRIEDLQRLPCLTRDLVRENIDDLVARNYQHSRLQYEVTGGTSGAPVGLFYEYRRTDEIEQAFIHSAWRRVGFNPGDRLAVLRGSIINPNRKGEFWEYDGVEHSLLLSSYHMTDDNLRRYVDRIRRFEPDFIFGFPSAVMLLAEYMNRNSLEPFETVKAVLCGSENVYPGLRATIETAFKTRVFSWYGHTERAVLAAECELSGLYHIFPEYGIVELLDANGAAVESSGSIGEIVATSLINFAFPLIRYRTGDMASYAGNSCKCGRNYRLLEGVDGRSQEFIVTKRGTVITFTAFIQHFSAFSKIKLIQFVQEKEGEIKVRIVKGPGYSVVDESEIRSFMLNSVSGDLDIGFEYTQEIARTRSGKHRFMIQQLALTRE